MIDSIGARLRQARELRHLTLQEVSETTKVRPPYLQALESDDLSAIPSAAQARGFLRIYAAFLELDLADLVPASPAPEPVSVTETVPPASAGIPAQDAAASRAARPNLWTNLRERLARRKNKDATAASISSVVPQEPSSASEQVNSPQLPEPVPASTEAKTKTSRRSKIGPTEPVSDISGSDVVDVKKNVEN